MSDDETPQLRRRVGSVRPSHLMFTTGVGSLIDLPNFSVLVKGLDDWRHEGTGQLDIAEPRLLGAVQSVLGKAVEYLKPAPWLDGLDKEPNGPASRVGVPVVPFPAWLRCTACNELGALDSGVFRFENNNLRRPHEAKFVHDKCPRGRNRAKKPLAVTARFVLSCVNGHLDEFPYREFVHRGLECPEATHPRLQMEDRGGNLGADVKITCVNCGQDRNIRDAMGQRGLENLPRCRGRHPHLGVFDQGCAEDPKVLTVGASNQWFAQTLSALAVPESGMSALDAKVDQHWDAFKELPPSMFGWARKNAQAFKEIAHYTDEEIAEAFELRRSKDQTQDGGQGKGGSRYPDLRTPEWEVFSAKKLPDPNDDFTLRRDIGGVPESLQGIYEDVVQAERLREVRALIGFTRLDAPDPEDPDLVRRVRLSRSKADWVPASEVRGEGIFLKLPEDLLQEWEKRVEESPALLAHREAYERYRMNRYSERIKQDFDPMAHWPGARYIALHTFSHLMIRTIALECGYSSASLSERIYSGTEDDPHRSGILIYTAVPDAEGTLGGLVSLAEPKELERLTRRALADARHCSSDPLCAERLPQAPADFLHGAACHVCLFVSETTCERGNKFLDRRFIVPVDDTDLALYPALP